LEIGTSARLLEVSVGTAANIPHLRSDSEVFGLDISWGMLKRCQKRLAKWKRTAELFQGEAERLPLHEGIFDVAFHVSGINFFNDKARAIAEMICVARAILGQSAEAIYGYTDAFGKELSQVVRYSPIRKHVV